MTFKEFVRVNRKEIDEHILKLFPGYHYKNDEERRLWILNDEGLYTWAREEGVKI